MSTSYLGTTNPAVRQSNRAAIFRAIYESAPIARVDLAARTGLTPKTVSGIVDELITHGLAKELGYRTSSGAGRKAVELEVDSSARFTIGVDVAHAAVTAALVDLGGVVHERVVDPPTSKPWHVSQTISTAADAVKRLLAETPADRHDKIVGLGIGAPGEFKIEDGRYFGLDVDSAGGWVDLGSDSDLRRQFRMPVALDNNANTSALAELWFGAGRGVSDFVLLNLSAGIGMGIVVGGDVYHGGNNMAGEAGHMTVNADGRTCACGNAGCLHQYVSVRAILDTVRARLAAGESSLLAGVHGPEIGEVIAALHAGDDLVGTVFADAGRYLAAALVSLVNTYDPQMILVGRDLATAGEPFIGKLRTELRNRINPAIRDDLRVEVADVTDSPLVGAAALALRDFFRAPLGHTNR